MAPSNYEKKAVVFVCRLQTKQQIRLLKATRRRALLGLNSVSPQKVEASARKKPTRGIKQQTCQTSNTPPLGRAGGEASKSDSRSRPPSGSLGRPAGSCAGRMTPPSALIGSAEAFRAAIRSKWGGGSPNGSSRTPPLVRDRHFHSCTRNIPARGRSKAQAARRHPAARSTARLLAAVSAARLALDELIAFRWRTKTEISSLPVRPFVSHARRRNNHHSFHSLLLTVRSGCSDVTEMTSRRKEEEMRKGRTRRSFNPRLPEEEVHAPISF